MSLLVVGSLALDSVETPFGHRENVTGGSASYFSIAASYFTEVDLVATVGEDFPEQSISDMKTRKINLDGLHVAPGKTFRWEGRYSENLNEAETLKTELNVFADFNPKLPASYAQSPYIFLANIDPDLQMRVLDQVDNPKFIGCDTMNYWIEGKYEQLIQTLSRVHLLSINETEAKMLAKTSDLFTAAQIIQEMGPSYVVIKRGEYGALLFCTDFEDIFFAPALPTSTIQDPTGAGDSFAGGLMGFIAQQGSVSDEIVKAATVIGSVMASFNISNFSYTGMLQLTPQEISTKIKAFQRLVCSEPSDPTTKIFHDLLASIDS